MRDLSVYQDTQDPAEITPVDAAGSRVTPLQDQWSGLKGDLAAGGYSALNEGLMGLPDFLVKRISQATGSDAYKRLQDLRAKHKLASQVGSGAGFVGSMFIPGGAITKGLGLGAKALGAVRLAKGLEGASDIIRGSRVLGEGGGILSKLGGAAARGAITGAEQSIPRALIQAGTTGDVGSAAQNAASGIAGGALLGGVIGGLPKVLGSVARTAGLANKGEGAVAPLSEGLTDLELSARGLNTRDMRKALTQTARYSGTNATGLAVNQAQDMKKAALKLLKREDIRNADEAQAFIQGTGKKFEALNAKWDTLGVQPSALKDVIMQRPDVQEYITQYGAEGQKVIDDMFNQADRAGNLSGVKALLAKKMRNANKASDNVMLSDSGDVAHAIREELDNAVFSLDPQYPQYKEDWKTLQPLRYMVGREKMNIAKPLTQGSDTAAKALALGLGGGGMAATGLKDVDWTDPASVAAYVAKIGGGLAAGSLINRAVPAAGNLAFGELAGLINSPKVLGMLEKLQGKISGEGAQKLGAAITGKILPKAEQAMGALPGKEERAGQTEIQSAPNVQAVADTEAETPAPQVEEAKQATNNQWADKISQNLKAIYDANFADSGFSFEDYVSEVGKATNGFDPKLSAQVVFQDPKERDAFLWTYDTAMKLKGVDIGKALTKSSFIEGLTPGDTQSRSLAKEQLRSIMGLAAGKGAILTKADQATIDQMISTIAAQKVPLEQKRQLLDQALQDTFGVDFATLQNLGLYGESNGNA